MVVAILALLSLLGLITAYLTGDRGFAWAGLVLAVAGGVLTAGSMVLERRAPAAAASEPEPDEAEQPGEADDAEQPGEADDEQPQQPEPDPKPEPVVMAPEPGPGPEPERESEVPAVEPDVVVLVVAGRKRYHRAGCVLLGERPTEELLEEEAREEGFTPCTRCAAE